MPPSLTPQIVLLHNPLIGTDLEAALWAAGVRVHLVEPAQITLSELKRLRSLGIEAFLSVNRSSDLALACREVRMRYISWTIDPVARDQWRWFPGTDEVLFVHRKALLRPLRAMGHERVTWLPLSAPSRRWSDPSPPRGTAAPSFVGSSLQDERRLYEGSLANWGLGAATAALTEFLDSIAELAERDLAFQGFLLQPGGVPESLIEAAQGKADRMDLAEALDAGLAWRFRRRVVARLAALGCEVRGDSGWEDCCGRSWSGPLLNGQEMTSFYRASALDVDVPRLHQRGIATLRAFDVLACGGVLALEAGTELEEIFRPGEHFLDWRTPEERDELVKAAASGGGAAFDLVAQAGREAAWEHRLEQRIERILAEF